MTQRSAILRIAAFSAWLLAAFVALHALISGGLRRLETGAFGVTNRIVAGQVNAEIVISGSSRALNHYDPRIIHSVTGKSAFNIGRNGSQTDMQLAVLKMYLAHNTKPRLVIHNLDAFSFKTSHDVYDPAQYLPYLDQEPLYAALRKIEPDAWKWRCLPLYGYAVQDMRFNWIHGLRAWTGWAPREDHYMGFNPRFTQWTGDFDAYRADHPQGVTFEIEPAGVNDLEELARLCQSNGIPLLFVYSPEYSEMQAMERNRSELFGQFQSSADRYHVPVWDYSDSAICRNRSYFYNSQHLNADGAAAFSQALAERLRQGEIKGAQP